MMNTEKKTVLVTGATGFVGRPLLVELLKKGYQVKATSRNIEKAKKVFMLPVEWIKWDPNNETLPSKAINGTDHVVHLLGESVSQKWSSEVKERLIQSREQSGLNILKAFQGQESHRLKSFISASAIGIYGNRKDELLTEKSAVGDGFLVDVCEKWESTADKLAPFSDRIVKLRIGVVLGNRGGALEKMVTPFKLGGGGPIGNGSAYMSWIHIDDLVSLIMHSIEKDSINGVYNATAPEAVKNKEFTQSLSNALGVPAILPAPELMLKLVFGEMSQIMTNSVRCSAEKIMQTGFQFKFSKIDEAMEHLFVHGKHKGAERYKVSQWLPVSKDKAFAFFSKAENLESITPDWLKFKIVYKSSENIEKGTVLKYKLKLKGIPISWVTEIMDWTPSDSFVDNQNKGPYALWYHSHNFTEMAGGTLIEDEILYKAPFPVIGEIANKIMISKDVENIFKHRAKVIERVLLSNN